jgi:hypothetical protein
MDLHVGHLVERIVEGVEQQRVSIVSPRRWTVPECELDVAERELGRRVPGSADSKEHALGALEVHGLEEQSAGEDLIVACDIGGGASDESAAESGPGLSFVDELPTALDIGADPHGRRPALESSELVVKVGNSDTQERNRGVELGRHPLEEAASARQVREGNGFQGVTEPTHLRIEEPHLLGRRQLGDLGAAEQYWRARGGGDEVVTTRHLDDRVVQAVMRIVSPSARRNSVRFFFRGRAITIVFFGDPMRSIVRSRTRACSTRARASKRCVG